MGKLIKSFCFSMTKILAPITLAALLVTSLFLSSATASDDPSILAPSKISHIVVIYQENISFDHYFATYPNAKNPAGEPKFTGSASTPAVNGLSGILLTSNLNLKNPFRLDRTMAVTCSMNHAYGAEQQAYDSNLVDMFVQKTGNTGFNCNPDGSTVMGYYDGNTVTALWNYAQHFAMSDNSYSTGYGPSTPGVLNLVSGQTHGAKPTNIAGVTVNGTAIGDDDPTGDDCGKGTTFNMTGKNVGDLLNAKNVTWGWFQGGFKPTIPYNTTHTPAVCGSFHFNINGTKQTDYSAHHEPFQYYASTANPHHLPPTSVAMIGHADRANHQYDISDFNATLAAGNLPAVSFLKAAKYRDGHPGYSDPLDEQKFLVDELNALQKSPLWSSTAVIIAYDDSDGWYDHVMPPVFSESSDPANDHGCGTVKPSAFNDRCGYGPRQPLLVISEWAKPNFVDHSITDQTSILRFIEDNFGLGRIGGSSFDAVSNPISNMLEFITPHTATLVLNDTTGNP